MIDRLLAAVRRAARHVPRRGETPAFLVERESEVLRLRRELLGGTWRPGPFRTTHSIQTE